MRIMDALEAQNVKPRPWYVFWLQNYAIWAVWLLSIVFGAVSLSVLWYAVDVGWYALFEATHETWLEFMVETVPYLWIPVFGLLLIVAVWDIRQTKRGYKYPLWLILSSSLLGSVALALWAVWFGVGNIVDRELGRIMPFYPSQERIEMRLWQQPVNGRLIGEVEEQNGELFVADVDGTSWLLDTSAVIGPDKDILVAGKSVRLLGIVGDDGVFVVCGAMPDIKDPLTDPEEFQRFRDVVRDRLQQPQLEAASNTPCVLPPPRR